VGSKQGGQGPKCIRETRCHTQKKNWTNVKKIRGQKCLYPTRVVSQTGGGGDRKYGSHQKGEP